MANIIAFVAFVGFLNAVAAWAGELVGFQGISFEVKRKYLLWNAEF